MQEEDNAKIIFPSGGGEGKEPDNIRNVCLAFLLAILR